MSIPKNRMVPRPLGKFKCMECGYEFDSFNYATDCPKCLNLYVKWLNYIECFEKISKSD